MYTVTENGEDRMGDSRPEGERNFWNGREAVSAKPQNVKVL